MSKQMFMTSIAATAHRGNNDANLAGTAIWWAPSTLSEARGTAASTLPATTVASNTTGIEVLSGAVPVEWLSEPLSADFTISGTITLNLWGFESAMNLHVGINAVIEKVDGATGAITQIAKSVRAVELSTSAAVNNFTVTPTSTLCHRGDRIRVRVFAGNVGTMVAGSMTFNYNGPTAAASGDSYIQFTENLTFEPAGVNGVLEQTATPTALNFGNLSTAQQIAQPFVAGSSNITRLAFTLAKNNTPTDNVIVEIQSDSGGHPSGTVVASVGTIPGSSVPSNISAASYFGFSGPWAVTQGSTYYLVLRRSGAVDSTNYYQNYGTTTIAAPWSSDQSYNGTAWGTLNSVFGISITFDTASVFYLTDTAETINPGSATEKKALTTRGSGSVNGITNTAAGPTAGIQVTATAGGTAIEWYTPPLQAFTLAGKSKFNLRGLESSTSAHVSLKVEIAVCATDGTSPVVWGVADVTYVSPGVNGGELSTTDAAIVAWVEGPSTAVTLNQRLRFRIFIDDCAQVPLVTGFTGTVSYNGATVGAAGDTYVILPVAVLQASPADAATIATKTTPASTEAAVYVEQPQIDLGTSFNNITGALAAAGATGLAQAFVNPASQPLGEVAVFLAADAGTDGTVEVAVWSDSSGHPGSNAGTVTVAGSGIIGSGRLVTFNFGSIALTTGATYWITVRRVSGTAGAVYVGIDPGNPYAPTNMQNWTVSGNAVSPFVAPAGDMTASVLMKTGVVPLASVTTPSGSELQTSATAYTEAATIGGITTPASTESAVYVEQPQITFGTNVSGFVQLDVASATGVAQQFVTNFNAFMQEVVLYLSAGGADGNVQVDICPDNAGKPGASFQSVTIPASALTNPTNYYTFNFTSISLASGSPAWITVKRTGGTVGTVSVGLDANGSYPSSSAQNWTVSTNAVSPAGGGIYDIVASVVLITGRVPIASVTTPSGSDVYIKSPTLDSATVGSVTTPSTAEAVGKVESATITSITTIPAPSVTASATITSVSVAPNSQILFTAGSDFPGVLGNNVWVEITPNDSLGATRVTAFGTTDNPHMFIEAPSVSGVITATAGSIITAVNAYQPNRLIAANAAGSDGTGIASAWNTGPNSGYYALYLNLPDVAQYAETGIVGSVTTPSSVDVYTPGGIAYTEAATISSVSNWSGSNEDFFAVDLQTPASVTTLSSVESRTITDASTVASVTVTTPSTVDVAAFIDSATCAGVTSLTSVELRTITDANTVSSVTTFTSTDVTAYIEAATLATVTTPTSVEIRAISDSSTLSSTTTPITTDVAAYVDGGVPNIVTTPSTVEIHEIPDSGTITSVTAPATSDIAAFTESNTLTSITTPSSVEVHELTDAATTASITTPGGSDIYTVGGVAYTEAATVSGVTTPSSVEIHEIPDSTTVASSTALSATEIAAYAETATVSGVTSVSTTETTQDVDANTGTTTTTITSSDIAALVDSGILATKTVPSSTDLAAYTDAATATSTTQPSTVETHEIPDSGMVPGTTTPSAIDIAAYVDANTTSAITNVSGSEGGFSETNTLTTTTSLTSIDVAAYVDGVIIASTSSVVSADLPAYTEVGTPTSITSITTVDVAAFVDGTIASGVTTPSGTEAILHGNQDTDTFTSQTTPSAIEAAAYVDAQTASNITSLSSVEVAPSDAATISGVTSVSSAEVAAFVDTATIAATTTSSSIDLPSLLDASTISGTTTFSGSDVSAYADSGTIISSSVGTAGEIGAYTDFALAGGITTLTSDEQLLHGNQDASILTVVTTLGSVEVAAYVDAATSQTTTTPSSDELRAISDAATIATSSVLSSVEAAQFVDASTNTSVTTLSATEAKEITDAGTINGITSLTSVETVPGADTNTVFGITSLVTVVEVHEIPDSNTVTGKTTPSAVEVMVVADLGTPDSATTISSTDLAAYVDTQVVSSVTTPSGVEGSTSGKTDADTVVSTVTLSAADVAVYVDQNTISGKTGVTSSEGGFADSNTIPILTIPTASDIALTVDNRIINSVTSLSTIEQATDTDNGIVSNTSTLIYSDISAYVESAAIIGTTSYSGTELSGVDYSDTTTIPTQTAVNYIEQSVYVETSTLVTRTSLTDLETTIYTDSSTVTTHTSVESTEFAKAPTFDAATISSVTIPGIVFEYAVKLSELVVVSYYVRWQSTSTSLRWSIPVRSLVRWSAKPLQGRFVEKVSRKWAAWTH